MTLFDIAYDDFKREDTTNTITITLYTDDKQPITPNSSHTWKAKVSKEDKYVGEYPVTISGNVIKLSSSNLTRLPNGDYGLELWETYSGSTTIYPSAGVMEFRVHRNANDTLGTVDPTTDINRIIDDLHKAGQNVKVVATNTLPPGSKASVTQSIINGENQLTFNIPQGDTDATATQALDIANSVDAKLSAIQANGGGRNLAVGTSSNWTTVPDVNEWNIATIATYSNAKAGDVFTISVDTQSTMPMAYQIWQGNATGVRSGFVTSDNRIASGTTHSHTTFTWPSGATQYLIVQLALNAPDGSHTSYQYKNAMLEKGVVAHDWQPALEDIQPQLDALKEAAKRVGGDNLAPLVAPVMSNVGAETESVTHGHAQRFVLPLKGTELLPKTNILVDVLSGDTLSQSFVIETDATSINGAFTFYMMNSDHHIVPFNVQQLTATKYLVSASYTTENDDKWRILDIMRLNLTGGTYVEFSNPYSGIDLSGGVVQTNLLANVLTQNTKETQVTINNGVIGYKRDASNTDTDFFSSKVSLVPGHTYRFTYMVRGQGKLASFVYNWTDANTGTYIDNQSVVNLDDDWQLISRTFTYTPNDTSSNEKNILFRLLHSSDTYQVELNDIKLVDLGGGEQTLNLLTNSENFDQSWFNADVSRMDEDPRLFVTKVKSLDNSLQQNVPSLESGANYILTFYAKGSVEKEVLHTEMWGTINAHDIELTSNWQKYSVVLTCADSKHPILYFWNATTTNGNIYIRAPYLTKQE